MSPAGSCRPAGSPLWRGGCRRCGQSAVLYSATFLNSIRPLFSFPTLSQIGPWSLQLALPFKFTNSGNLNLKLTSKLNQFGLQVQVQYEVLYSATFLNSGLCLLFQRSLKIGESFRRGTSPLNSSQSINRRWQICGSPRPPSLQTGARGARQMVKGRQGVL